MKLGGAVLLVFALFAVANASEAEFAEMYRTLFQQLDEKERSRVLEAVRTFDSAQACDERYCNDPDCGKNVTQLITSKGYPCEEHRALTSDGYWLSMQRIPYGRAESSSTPGKTVVFLQHGLIDASHTWVINSPAESLGFILADAGFDVWMGNNRGNTYSNTNEFYSYDDSDFWKFSWDEMGSIDLPTQINYTLAYTGQKQLFYVGHSEGTTQAFAGFEDPELASKVKLFIALAPVASIANMGSTFLNTLAFDHIDTALEVLGFDKFLVHSCWLSNLLDAVCTPDDAILCQIGMCIGAGCDPDNMNATRYDVYVQLSPAGTSVQNINHWGQMARTGDFCMYDFLTRHGNEDHYGQAHPPCYDLSKMAAPVALFYGGKDKLGDPTDVQWLMTQLNPDVLKYSTEIDYYEHMDFVWGLDAGTVLYPEIISLIKDYE